ncbi:MAG: shikimate dehydrogenase [Rhodospirillales bacterium]|nr:shikimate dehydrogenase [Rhodospirillales bacterium]
MQPRIHPSIMVGLIGQGIQKSRSPVMHETEAAALGLKLTYLLLDTDRMPQPAPPLEEILRSAEICGLSGLNITFPYKVKVIEHLDGLSDSAQLVGAVNTVVFRDGRRYGHNTDLWGFAEAFRRELADAKRDHVLLLGTGGGGAAVAHALLACDVKTLWLFDIDMAKAEALATDIRACQKYAPERVKLAPSIADIAGQLDGVVNASPVGMAKFPGCAFPAQHMHARQWIADIVYFPLETELLRRARGLGCRTLAGSGMAVGQAARAFKLFTGRDPDHQRIETAFNAIEETGPE